ncbi:MAG: Leucine, isoleucine, valine-, threonine-, and alanine-binding protein [Herbaspirillum sp.]|nr:Leucine, isoleucine, valine-, threonine-, and alanine-binding protein [Herbaspirillum sp.]
MRFPITATSLRFGLTVGLTIGLTAITFATSAPIANTSTAMTQEVVKIGLTGPLTGPQLAVGKDNEAATNMAIDELNQKKIIIGNKSITFQLVSEDDQADPKIGMIAARNLIEAKVKAVLGPYNSGVALPTSKLYNDANIVMATIATNPRITQQGFQYVFRFAPNDNQLGGDMAIYAAKQLKLKKVAVIDDRSIYGQGVAEAFLAAAKASKINIVNRRFSTETSVEFGPILSTIKNQRVDGIFYGGYFTPAVALKQQMKQMGVDAILMGGDGICNAQAGMLGGDIVNDKIYCVQGGSTISARTSGKVFLADYRKRYGKLPLTFAPYCYDSMKMLAAAMQKADSTDPVKFAPILAAMRYTGVTGDYEFDAAHDLKNSPVTIYQFKGGEPVPMPAN